jgi:hypothetical protein
MRGRRKMVLVLTTSLAALLCQGCTHKTQEFGSEPTVAPSVAMLLATGEAVPEPGAGIDIGFAAATDSFEQREIPGLSVPAAVLGPAQDDFDTIDGQGLTVSGDAFVSPLGLDSANISSLQVLQEVSADLAAARLSPEYDVQQNFGGEISLAAPAYMTGLGVDLGFAPRASIREEGGVSSRRFGAEIRLGEGLDERGRESSANSWYIFAAQDGEALCWDVGDAGWSPAADVRLRDQVTVGDLQAGLSINRMGGQFSVSYIRREVEYSDRSVARASETEDFAGVSFTLRR